MKPAQMKYTIGSNKVIENVDIFVEPELTVTCKHCGTIIDSAKLIGFSLICPLCGKPQNGHPLISEDLRKKEKIISRFSTRIQK